MSLTRLRRVLTTELTVRIESSTAMVARVAAAAAKRAYLTPKPAAVYLPFAAPQELTFRPIEFLRKIGELTTPKNVNLARLAASWATRRYFWAVEDPGSKPRPVRFRLSADARQMDRHQKTLLSDEFGMGFAGLVAERLLGAPEFVDVDFALSNSAQYFGVRAKHRRRPDFLMWGNTSSLFVVECKGSQTRRASVVAQLRRGLEQLPSIDARGTNKVSLVIAAHMHRTNTTVHVIDPPGEGSSDAPPPRRPVDDSVDLVGRNSYAISNLERFRDKLRTGADLLRLRWAGQHGTAESVVHEITGRARRLDVQDAPLERVETVVGDFVGTATPLAPELGTPSPQLFRGVRSEFLDRFELDDRNAPASQAVRGRFASDDPRFSAGENGTCLAILALDI